MFRMWVGVSFFYSNLVTLSVHVQILCTCTIIYCLLSTVYLLQLLKGNVGLFFTNHPRDKVISWFQSYCEQDHARAGCLATDDVILEEGPLVQFPHSVEPHLRGLGLPTTLNKGQSVG